ncbi:hypothetical protein G9A89_019234 [Geosiphon pyriformis]|nr:hypothetical protein G9A89_019234 [Geosiphon pyriformis]
MVANAIRTLIPATPTRFQNHKSLKTYVLIAKLEKFTGEKDNAQIWLNDVEKAIVANR